jgi:hypothetical protein
MIKCPNCQTPNRDTANFCTYCSTPLHPSNLTCPACGAINPAPSRYCNHCAAPLSVKLPQVTSQPTGMLPLDTLLENRYRIIRCIGHGGMGRCMKRKTGESGENAGRSKRSAMLTCQRPRKNSWLCSSSNYNKWGWWLALITSILIVMFGFIYQITVPWTFMSSVYQEIYIVIWGIWFALIPTIIIFSWAGTMLLWKEIRQVY